MAEAVAARRWAYRALFVALAAGIAFLALLPLAPGQAAPVPGPDLLLCLVFAWVLRRPDYVPVALVAAVVLVTDMLYLRPPGLWTALVVVGTEGLRAARPRLGDLPFPAEWATVAALVAALGLAHYLALGLAGLAQPRLNPLLLQIAVTSVAYPPIVLLSRGALGVRAGPRAAMGPAGGRA